MSEQLLLEQCMRALREMLFYADHCGTAGARTGRARALQTIQHIETRLLAIETETQAQS